MRAIGCTRWCEGNLLICVTVFGCTRRLQHSDLPNLSRPAAVASFLQVDRPRHCAASAAAQSTYDFTDQFRGAPRLHHVANRKLPKGGAGRAVNMKFQPSNRLSWDARAVARVGAGTVR